MKRTKLEKVERLEWATGCVATELTGKYGALWGAQRKLGSLGHVAVNQGATFECAKCGKRAHVEPIENGFVLRGDATAQCVGHN